MTPVSPAELDRYAGRDVAWLLTTRARDAGDRPFFHWEPVEADGARTVTYRDLHRDASALAAGMARRGIGRGDRVLVHLDNSPEFITSWFACALLGASAVTTNTQLAPPELAWIVGHAKPRAGIAGPTAAGVLADAGLEWLAVVPDDDAALVEETFGSLFGEADALPVRPPDPSLALSIQYTSGTTSRPKGVVWKHANGLWAAEVNARHESLTRDDVHLAYLPLYHTNALAYSMLATMWVGGTFVLVPKWTTSRFWDISLRHGCTWLCAVEFSFKAIAQAEIPKEHSYRLFGTGVCDTPYDQMLGIEKTLGWWGMTETVSHGIVGDVDVPNRPMSMGRPAPEYGIAVLDDDGRPVPDGEVGELVVHGVPGMSLFAEYLDDADATREAFIAPGWLRTGDLVVSHPDGHLDFVDRRKDMLKVGGENVAASEVERVLLARPDVESAAVVSAPDEMYGEVPVAFVVAAPGVGSVDVDAALEHCRAELAAFKVPRAIEVVEDLPRVTLGKVDKKALRARTAGG